MTDRGRPRKATSPDTKCAKIKTTDKERKKVCLSRSPRKCFTEEREPGTTKEQKPKEQRETHHTEEKPSVQDKQKKKTIKQQMTPKGSRNDTAQDTKTKICEGKAQTTERSAEEVPKTQPETPKMMMKDSAPITKPKTRAYKVKSSKKKLAEGTPKMQPEIQRDTTKDSLKTTKSPVEIAKETPKDIKQDSAPITTPETHTKACVSQGGFKDKAAVDSILRSTLEKLKIKRDDRTDTAEVINKIKDDILQHLKQNSKHFKEVGQPLHTGSYYENLKISHPDEFDVMLPIPVGRVKVTPFGNDGAFYIVTLKRGQNPLKKFQNNEILSGSEMLKEFRDEVKKCVMKFQEWKVEKKKKGCPAVTLTTEVQSVTISLDVVLSLEIKSSWPPFTKGGFEIKKWQGTKVKQEYKQKPFYLVPKYNGRGTVEKDGVPAKDVWRISFSHIEKDILRNHGSAKTCCEKGSPRCCRKDCLKLLKHLLSLLKEKNPSFDKFCSYHAKTTLFHACCSRPHDSEWSSSSLSLCFQLLLDNFVAHLESGVLCNFFIPAHNLLSGISLTMRNRLARSIREESEKGFPIFQANL